VVVVFGGPQHNGITGGGEEARAMGVGVEGMKGMDVLTTEGGDNISAIVAIIIK